MYYTTIDSNEILSNKIPTMVCNKFKDDAFNVTVDMLHNKTVLQNLVTPLFTTNIDVTVWDASEDSTIYTMYSMNYIGFDGRFVVRRTSEDYSKALEFTWSSDVYGKRQLTVPFCTFSELKKLWVAIFTYCNNF